MLPAFQLYISALLKKSTKVAIDLFSIMVPIIIVVKILKETGTISYIAMPLAPVMELVGLPAEMGLAWATALVNSMYSGLVVFLSLAQDTPVTAAQATVLGCMLLVAHGLPLESGIARKSGPRFCFQCIIRICGALLLGVLLNTTYSSLNILQEPANILLQNTGNGQESILQWGLGELKNLLYIYGVIIALMLLMDLLERIGVIAVLNKMLRPILKLIGIGPKASAITVIGLSLGLSYGGGLILHEVQSGSIKRQDVFYSITLMGLCHSLIEDTLLMIMIGGHLSGLLWGRLFFSLIIVGLLVQICRRLPQQFCDKYLWGPAPSKG